MYEEALKNIYFGTNNLDTLPVDIYLNNRAKLIDAINKGFGKKLSDINILDEDYELLKSFHDNASRFSGSKLYQEVNDVSNFVLNAEGKRRSINAFLEDAKKIDRVYNKRWLDIEYDAFIKRADKAREWKQFEKEKDIFPMLQFQTVGDSKVRPEHVVLDGIIKPVNDPFWNTYSPPLDYGCRCLINQLEEGKVTPDSDIDFKEAEKEVSKQFRNNPAKTGYIFNETGKGMHPYFKVPKEKLNTNFGFGID